jgi:hypothetical protein
MADEGFLSRWSRRKAQVAQAKAAPGLVDEPADEPPPRAEPAAPPAPAATQPPADEQQPALTMEDVAALTPDSDFSAFVARGVDENVKRSALKKLFSDPHFNVMDGLDIYIGDYTKPDPIPPAVLAMLNHAQGLLNPLSLLERQPMRLLDEAQSALETEKDGPPDNAEAEQPPRAEAEETAGAGEDAEQAAGEPTIAADGNDDPTDIKEARP